MPSSIFHVLAKTCLSSSTESFCAAASVNAFRICSGVGGGVFRRSGILLLFMFVSISVFGVVDTKQSVQAIFASVRACSACNLSCIHFLLVLFFSRYSTCRVAIFAICNGRRGLDVIMVANQHDFITDRQEQAFK